MRRLSFLALTALIILTASDPLSAGQLDEKTARQAVLDHYAKCVDAYKKKDVKAYVALVSPDFKGQTWDGEAVDRKKLEAWAKQDMAETQTITSARLALEKVTPKDNEETHEGTEIWKFKFVDLRGQYGPKGKSYDVVWKQRGRATLVKAQQGWLLKRLEYLNKPSLTSGGKPLIPLAQKKP